MDKELQKDFQQRSVWIFSTIIILLIQTSPSFSDLVLEFVPGCNSHKKYIQLLFIVFGFFLFGWIYWWDWIQRQKSHDFNKMSQDELLEKAKRKFKRLTWQQNIFKYYPLNIIKLRIIPLFICWVISRFINKKHKPYLFDSFYFPKYWEEYSYEEVISKFFKSMFRVCIGELNQSYEVKFGKDFQHIELRWIDRNTDNKIFSESRNELYEKILSENRFKHIKIFTWIFPFGLYWNLRRVIKTLFQRRKN